VSVGNISRGLADPGTAFPGSLLVATPLIDEPTFRRAIVLILDHSSEGSLGVVLNDESDVSVEDVIPDWGGVLDPVIAIGGPVQSDAGVAVAGLRTLPTVLPEGMLPEGVLPEGMLPEGMLPEGLRTVAQGWAVMDLDGEPALVADLVAEARLFLGYSGWGPGQLEEELSSGSWWVVASQPGDLSLGQGVRRVDAWRQVLRRQVTDLRFAVTYPDDPSAN